MHPTRGQICAGKSDSTSETFSYSPGWLVVVTINVPSPNCSSFSFFILLLLLCFPSPIIVLLFLLLWKKIFSFFKYFLPSPLPMNYFPTPNIFILFLLHFSSTTITTTISVIHDFFFFFFPTKNSFSNYCLSIRTSIRDLHYLLVLLHFKNPEV